MSFTDLFSFEGELNEDLLQFLINIIYTKLFKSILCKYFKSVNVQDSNVELLRL